MIRVFADDIKTENQYAKKTGINMEYKNNKTSNRRRYKSRYHSPHSYKTKRGGSSNRAPILIGVATFLILASLVLVFTFGDKIYSFLDTTFHPSALPLSESETMGVVLATEEAAPPAVVSVPEATEAQPEPTQADVDQSDDFNRLLTAAALKPEDLTGTQAIFVESQGTAAKVYFYEKAADGQWNRQFDIVDGFVGTGGTSDNVGPADDTTPKGTYNIEYAMGTNMNPGTALDYYQIQFGMNWVTDPASVNYNRLVDSSSPVDYTSSQQLYEYTKSYPYAVVFDYNRDPVDNTKGCARFLHVATEPTYGGVGISENALGVILGWLNPTASPTITII